MKISIITCTYNPDAAVIGRTLAAVERLVVPPEVTVEYILVDNNSSPAFAGRPEFGDFLARNAAWVRVVWEGKPGLSNARIAGLQVSTGEIIVFFDDDNEPEPNYLTAFMAARHDYPEVGIWSPGNVWVEFIGDPDPWTRQYGLEKLQELHIDEVKITGTDRNFAYLPYGTGMIAERPILEAYAKAYGAGAFTATDRSGKSLSSAGDIQIVYTALGMGKSVGRTPGLRLRHLITAIKSNFNYMKRLYYGCSIEGFSVLAQSFPGEPLEPARPLADTLKFAFYNTFYLFRMGLLERNPKKWVCQTAGMIANVEGKYKYYQKPLPFYLQFLKSQLKLS